MPAIGLLVSRRRAQASGAGAPTGCDWCGLQGPVSRFSFCLPVSVGEGWPVAISTILSTVQHWT